MYGPSSGAKASSCAARRLAARYGPATSQAPSTGRLTNRRPIVHGHADRDPDGVVPEIAQLGLTRGRDLLERLDADADDRTRGRDDADSANRWPIGQDERDEQRSETGEHGDVRNVLQRHHGNQGSEHYTAVGDRNLRPTGGEYVLQPWVKTSSSAWRV